jgi:hypothetical protein
VREAVGGCGDPPYGDGRREPVPYLPARRCGRVAGALPAWRGMVPARWRRRCTVPRGCRSPPADRCGLAPKSPWWARGDKANRRATGAQLRLPSTQAAAALPTDAQGLPTWWPLYNVAPSKCQRRSRPTGCSRQDRVRKSPPARLGGTYLLTLATRLVRASASATRATRARSLNRGPAWASCFRLSGASALSDPRAGAQNRRARGRRRT